MNSSSPAQAYLERLHKKLKSNKEGALADYIPELALVDPDLFAIAIVTVDGQLYQVGDTTELFTIQSASKPICYGLALEDRGVEEVQKYVGVEPSGEAFNSLSLDPDTGRPKNPMINAGAIASTSLIKAKDSDERLQRLIDTFSRFMGRIPVVDESVYLSESKTGHRNRALNSLMRSFGIVPDDNDEALDVYFKQCSLSVNCLDMANIAACLANNGVNPITSVQALKSKYVSKVLSVMSSCGMYDFSGGWIYEVGMPAKSGVGGGIMAVLPGQFGLAVFSPLLDERGNSVKGIQVCRQLSEDFNLHLFHTSNSTTSSVIRHKVDGSILQSCRARSAEDKSVLSKNSSKIKIYSLQGELMFGATDALTQHVLNEKEHTSCTILDLNHVLNIDQASMKLIQEMTKNLLA
ncbi:MAG: glutaminase A, partial [Gammaproteobacteria bacterium]|nr:glutaminase A [Gammaproteobacteria bacterium]